FEARRSGLDAPGASSHKSPCRLLNQTIDEPRGVATAQGCSPGPSSSSALSNFARNTCLSRRQTVSNLSAPPAAIAPPSMGQPSRCHVPDPSFLASENDLPPSLELHRYISRAPSSTLRHMMWSVPSPSYAAEGWQHSQTVPEGDA